MKRRAFFKTIGGFFAGLAGAKCLGGVESEPEIEEDMPPAWTTGSVDIDWSQYKPGDTITF